MKTLPLASFAVTLLAAALAVPYSPRVEASAGVQRCQADDGTVVYTDKACRASGAAALPVSGELQMRIANDRRVQAMNPDAPTASGDAISAMPVRAAARRSMSAGCAQSPTQLTMDLQSVMAMGDVNRIAESYHWVGMSNTAGQRTMARLESLTAQPLVEVRYFDATMSTGLAAFADASQTIDQASSAGGVMQLSFGNGTVSRVIDFDVKTFKGCYFIRF